MNYILWFIGWRACLMAYRTVKVENSNSVGVLKALYGNLLNEYFRIFPKNKLVEN